MNKLSLTISLIEGRFAICQLPTDVSTPAWAIKGEFSSITRTSDELSIVCLEDDVPEGVKCEMGWMCFKVHGPFDFSLTGVLNSLTEPLAQAGIGIFAVSTYDTDYLLIKQKDREAAVRALTHYGHLIED